MTWVAGVDGCPKGWFRASREVDSGVLRFDLIEDAKELCCFSTGEPTPAVVGIDMPIGLPAQGARACDRAARERLGARRSSVFPAPIRAALRATSHEEASRITEAVDGRRVSVQAWNLFARIRELDILLAPAAGARAPLREVHPEVSFCAWNGGQPMAAAKRSPDGRRERLALVEAWLGEGVLERARGPHPKKHLADDDILDSIAVLWTAQRIAEGRAQTLPGSPPRDEIGLPMEIVF